MTNKPFRHKEAWHCYMFKTIITNQNAIPEIPIVFA